MVIVTRSEVKTLSSAELQQKWREARQNTLGSRQAVYNPVTKTYTRADAKGATSYLTKEEYDKDQRSYKTYSELLQKGYVRTGDAYQDPFSAAMSKRAFTDSTEVVYVPTLTSPAQARQAEETVLAWQREDAKTTKENIERQQTANAFIADLNASQKRIDEKKLAEPTTLKQAVTKKLGPDITTRAAQKNNELYDARKQLASQIRTEARNPPKGYFSPAIEEKTYNTRTGEELTVKRLDPLKTVFQGTRYAGVRIEDAGYRITSNIERKNIKAPINNNIQGGGRGDDKKISLALPLQATRGIAKYEGRVLKGLGGYMVDKPSRAVSDVALGAATGFGAGMAVAKTTNYLALTKGPAVASKVSKGIGVGVIGAAAVPVVLSKPEDIGRGIPMALGAGLGYVKGFKAGKPGIVELSASPQETVSFGTVKTVGDNLGQKLITTQKVKFSFYGQKATGTRYTETILQGTKGRGIVSVSQQTSGITKNLRPFGYRTSNTYQGVYGDDYSRFVSSKGDALTTYKVAQINTPIKDSAAVGYDFGRQVTATRYKPVRGAIGNTLDRVGNKVNWPWTRNQYTITETAAFGEGGVKAGISKIGPEKVTFYNAAESQQIFSGYNFGKQVAPSKAPFTNRQLRVSEGRLLGPEKLRFKETSAYQAQTKLRTTTANRAVYNKLLLGDQNYIQPRTLFGDRKATTGIMMPKQATRIIQKPSANNKFGGALPDFNYVKARTGSSNAALFGRSTTAASVLSSNLIGASDNRLRTITPPQVTGYKQLIKKQATTFRPGALTAPIMIPQATVTRLDDKKRSGVLPKLSYESSTIQEQKRTPIQARKQFPISKLTYISDLRNPTDKKKITVPRKTIIGGVPIFPPPPPPPEIKIPPPPLIPQYDIGPVLKRGGKRTKKTRSKDKKAYLPSLAGITLKIKQKNKQTTGFSGLELRGV